MITTYQVLGLLKSDVKANTTRHGTRKAKKIFRILNSTINPELYFDFGLEKGDKLPNNDNIVYWYDDSISVDGFIEEGTKTQTHIYRRMRFAEEGLTENPKLSDWCLVEGIGGNEGILFANFQSIPQDCIFEKFMYCEQFLENINGYPVYENLFTKDDFLTTTSNVWEDKKCATPTISYDKGRLVFSCETPGAECVYELSCSDNGSGRGGEVSLSQTYEIRVHATLDGYEDSDVATAIIGWCNGKPVMEGFSSVTLGDDEHRGDVNGDGIVDVADIATVISIIAAKKSE